MNHPDFFSVEDVCFYFQTRKGIVKAVDQVSFELKRSRSMVIVGESGCGKSSLGRAILRLLPQNVAEYTGQIWLNGENIMGFSDERFRRQVRWIQAALVPQAAMNSLNPVVKIEEQVAEPLLVHNIVEEKEEALQRARRAFRQVGVAEDFLHRYPFELSGGMRQRVAIAMALVTDPDIVLLDEPTSALDMLTQANIMNVLKRIKEEIGISFLLITHDISTASEISDMAAVMYAGQLVEYTDAYSFFDDPCHPYSRKLLASVPSLKEDKDLDFIPGQPPSLLDPPTGCHFADRCHRKHDRCAEDPPLVELEEDWLVKCWLYT